MPKITLKAARVNAGLTQQKAAAKLGVNKKTVGSWEKGRSLPQPTMIDKICELYGIEYDNIVWLVS